MLPNQENSTQFFSFKIYTPVEAILLFIVALVGGMCLIFFGLGSLVNLREWNESVLKALLLLSVLGVFALTSTLSSATLTVKVDNLGLHFLPYRSYGGLSKEEKLILWADIFQWDLASGHISGETWSPATFTIKLRNGKKHKYYLTDNVTNERDFAVFLNYFKAQIAIFNAQCMDATLAIKEKQPFLKPKVGAIIIGLAFFLFCCVVWWQFIYHNPQPNREDWLLVIGNTFLTVFIDYFCIRQIFAKGVQN